MIRPSYNYNELNSKKEKFVMHCYIGSDALGNGAFAHKSMLLASTFLTGPIIDPQLLVGPAVNNLLSVVNRSPDTYMGLASLFGMPDPFIRPRESNLAKAQTKSPLYMSHDNHNRLLRFSFYAHFVAELASIMKEEREVLISEARAIIRASKK